MVDADSGGHIGLTGQPVGSPLPPRLSLIGATEDRPAGNHHVNVARARIDPDAAGTTQVNPDPWSVRFIPYAQLPGERVHRLDLLPLRREDGGGTERQYNTSHNP